MDKDFSDRVVEETLISKSDAPYFSSPDETPICPPATSFPSATNNKENSESDQNDKEIKTKGTLETAKEACIHALTMQQENTQPLQEDTSLTQDSDKTKEINSAHCFTSLVGSLATKPENFPLSTSENVSELLAAHLETFKAVTDAQEQEKHCEDISVTPKKVFSIVLDMEQQVISSIDFPEKKSGIFTLISPESDKTDLESIHPAAQSETLNAATDAQEKEKYCEDIRVNPDKVFTIVLDMQQRENVGASSPDVLRCSQGAELCDAKLKEVSSTGFPEKKSGLFTTLISPQSDETQVADLVPENPMALLSTEPEEVKSTSAKLSCKENSETHDLMHNEALNSSKLCGTVDECQITGAHAAETTFPGVKQEEMIDFCHAEEQTMSSVLCTVEGDALTETQIPAGDNKQTAADTAQSTGIGHLEMAEVENTEEASDPECPESKLSKMPKKQDKATLPVKESESKITASLEDPEVTQVMLY